MPYRPVYGLKRTGTEGSSTEDFRGVIDDLTVANKKLKQRLRKYERMHDAHLEDEKLFEVRFHGLPEHKKKELEETLRKFAANLNDVPDVPVTNYPAALDPQKTTSSFASQFADSGYNSLSASGRNSTSINTASGQNSDRKISKSQYNQQQQNVRSYLQDIPVGLLPTHNAPMSDKTKKKLVVRRLEQIFAGKRSTPGNHPQPMQQEEVAQSAAMADRKEKEATGQSSRKEGHREARIMPLQANEDDMLAQVMPEILQKFRPHLNINEKDFAGASSPDQRPTRPLDLDPYRAQVPTENMDYFRHLGFSPPNMDSQESPLDGHGWIYLNLLINMAQLHTINVTPEFVKAAVTEYSSMFELSPEGRKIRWRGGYDLTRHSDSSSEYLGGISPPIPDGSHSSKSPAKQLKTGDSSSTDVERQARRAARAAKEQEQRKFSYKPIFNHKDDSEDEDDYNFHQSSSTSPFMTQARGDSSGFNSSSAMRSSSSRRMFKDGPMIFYSKAKFCTDLSGDRNGLSVVDPSTYNTLSIHPLGMASPKHGPRSKASLSEYGESHGLLNTSTMDVDSIDSGRVLSSDEGMEFSLDSLQDQTNQNSPELMDFEVSGLGGVQPEDNFSIQVRRSQTKVDSHGKSRKRKSNDRHYSKAILDALHEQQFSDEGERPPNHQGFIREEILSASRKNLPSSELPPASFLPFDSTSSGDVDSDLDSDVSSNPSSTSSDNDNGPFQPQIRNQYHSIQDNNDDEEEDDDDDDSGAESDSESIDLLASARIQNPNAVRISEREYDSQLADRLVEEIPAGSSAATAGGGSGFNTPASFPAQTSYKIDEKNQSRQGSGSASSKRMKRTHTRDSDGTTLPSGEKGQWKNRMI